MENDLGTPIAYGRTAEIYAWGEEQVLKLCYDWVSLGAVQFEQRICRAVHASGVSAPAVGEIVQLNGRHGLVFQRVAGISMFEALAKRPWNGLRYARCMADLQAAMHNATTSADLPRQHPRLRDKIQAAESLPNPLRAKALAVLESLPVGDRLCHGDFHPGNLMVTDQGATIIDWIDTTLGNPLADVARTSVIMLSALETEFIANPALRVISRLFHNTYLRRYFSLRPGGQAEYHRWLPVVAAARLEEGIKELEDWLLKQAEQLE
jgi:Ser/Thr protein kinase RdoA (MazF antagonist)